MKFAGKAVLIFSVICAWCSGARAQDEIANQYEQELRAAAEARSKDKAWQPATQELRTIQIGDKNSPGAVRNYCLNKDGNLLVCFGRGDSAKDQGLRVYSPDGKLLKTIPLAITPTAVAVAKDGTVFVAGSGKVLKLNDAGKVAGSAKSPVADAEVVISSEVEEMVKEMAKQNRTSVEDELERMKTMLTNRRSEVTGLAVTESDVFMAVPAPTDFTYRVYRFTHALTDPKLVVEKLRGCCGQMDVQADSKTIWIPHNARHAVENLDRDGKQLNKFGKAGKVRPSDFGGCCEPKSMRVLPDGDILVAESGPPTCIKRFTSSGKFKEVVALVEDAKGDCVRVTVEMSPDGSKYYMLDTTRDAIRVFAAKR